MAEAILLAGATGLVGRHVLQRIARDPALAAHTVAIARRAPKSAGVRVVLAPLEDAAADATLAAQLRAALAGEPLGTFVSCLGTTIATAGSRDAFAAVDHALVLRLARIAHAFGATHAILVSSVGADERSRNFYLRTKGRIERDLERVGFERLDALRPGLLLGERDEQRKGEAIARRVMPALGAVLAGPLRRYRGIAASEVASAVVALLGERHEGTFVHEYDALRRLATGERAPE